MSSIFRTFSTRILPFSEHVLDFSFIFIGNFVIFWKCPRFFVHFSTRILPFFEHVLDFSFIFIGNFVIFCKCTRFFAVFKHVLDFSLVFYKNFANFQECPRFFVHFQICLYSLSSIFENVQKENKAIVRSVHTYKAESQPMRSMLYARSTLCTFIWNMLKWYVLFFFVSFLLSLTHILS